MSIQNTAKRQITALINIKYKTTTTPSFISMISGIYGYNFLRIPG